MNYVQTILIKHPELEYVTTGITHPGQAHLDDYLFAALACYLCPNIKAWSRFNPNDDQLKDKTILIGDVGMTYDPDHLVFDHHQQGVEGDCAASLFCKYLGIHEDMKSAFKWYQTMIDFDIKGPYVVCASRNIPASVIREFGSPIAGYYIRRFENEELSVAELAKFGEYLLDIVGRLSVRMKVLDQHVMICTIKGNLPIVVYPDKKDRDPSFGLEDWKEIHCPNAAGSIIPDIRDPIDNRGWVLYRFNDHPSIDFRLLQNQEEKYKIRFIHKNGFLAKIEPCSIIDAITVFKQAIIH